jgi:hypothetical protein
MIVATAPLIRDALWTTTIIRLMLMRTCTGMLLRASCVLFLILTSLRRSYMGIFLLHQHSEFILFQK